MDTRHINIKVEDLHPVYQALTQMIGMEAAVKLGQEYGGQMIYFPRLDALTIARRLARDRKIAEDYESGKYTKQQLGIKYKMTGVGIGSILKRAKARKNSS
jgi:Mor family transcriptional regulator